MDSSPPVLPLFRLLQLADSAFPVGSFAYSHGLETLVAEGRVRAESDLARLLERVAAQPLRRQTLPAAAAAWRAGSTAGRLAADQRLDASLTLPGERTSSRAMGRRLLDLVTEIEPSLARHPFRLAVLAGETQGHYPVAFSTAARELRVPLPETLAALAQGMMQSLISAATRLGVIGPAAAARLLAGAAPALSAAVAAVLAERPPRHFGSWLPTLEIGAARHPYLPFRMFAT
ncbi:MAG: urease accessory protein UreF [Tepidiforma sp.]|nr:MAG: urease accessory protein UreF [Tepidiforma sp.]